MIKKTSISERILYLIEKQYNNNRKKFAESINYSPQVIGNIVSGRKSKPSFDVIKAIISTNEDINIEWLINGKGLMLKQAKPSFPNHLVGKPDDPEEPIHKMMLKNARNQIGQSSEYIEKKNTQLLKDHIEVLKETNQLLKDKISYLEKQLNTYITSNKEKKQQK